MDSQRSASITVEEPILITGATGFLGSRTLERLASIPVRGALIASGRTLRPESRIASPRVSYQLGDLSDQTYVEKLIRENQVSAIVHCAALSAPWGAMEDFQRANVLVQSNLIRSAEQFGVKRFVYVSTPSIYVNFQDQQGVRESDPLPARMANAYAQTKWEAEGLLQQSQLSWVTIRPRALIGRGDTVIMPRILRAYHSGRLRIMGSGKNMVDLTPVANVVDALLLALSAPQDALRQAYNISNGSPVPLWIGINYVLTQLGLTPPVRRIPAWVLFKVASLMEWRARNFEQNREPILTRYGVSTLSRSFSLDITKAQLLLGYQPRQSVWEAIDEFVEWSLKQSR